MNTDLDLNVWWLLLVAMLATAGTIGCTTQGPNRASVPLSTVAGPTRGVYVVAARLTHSRADGRYMIATYAVGPELSSATVGVDVDLGLSFLRSTMSEELPTSALIVLKKSETGLPELLGEDASRSILKDTLENRDLLKTRLNKGELVPKRGDWIPKDEAIDAALKEISTERTIRTRYSARARRYEFGWIIELMPDRETPPRIGEGVVVRVGDDGTVMDISLGL